MVTDIGTSAVKIPKYILPVIIVSQFFGTSLWFAGNGVMEELRVTFDLESSALAYLTTAVQLGFIGGTLAFSLLSISDRYSPSKVFLLSAILGSLTNLGVILQSNTFLSLLVCRFFTGFFLAGIYPVGMKIAADYFEKGLGESLGFLVGALVVGTAFPHLLQDMKGDLPWKYVIIATSALATMGGFLMLVFVPNGPFRKASQKLEITAITQVFAGNEFRAAASGYFGHMWELYGYWVFVPVMLNRYSEVHPDIVLNIPVWSFVTIAVGGIACVFSGLLSKTFGAKCIATVALFLSGCCCLLSPLFFSFNSAAVFIAFLIFWGMVAPADSPLFSSLVAQNAPSTLKGTALTIVNCIGYIISIVSLEILNQLNESFDANTIFIILAVGPILGVMALLDKTKTPTKAVVHPESSTIPSIQ